MSSVARITIESAGEAAPKKPTRAKYTLADKRQLVEESFQPQASVARVAREHGINANQLFTWRRLYRRGQLGTPARSAPPAPLLAVRISDAETAPTCLPQSSPMSAGTIQLQTERGRLQVEGAVDPESLRLVLEHLLA